VLFIIPLHQVHHNATTLEQIDGLAIGELVRERGDAAIGINGKEFGRLLLVGGESEFLDIVGKATSRDISVRFFTEYSGGSS